MKFFKLGFSSVKLFFKITPTFATLYIVNSIIAATKVYVLAFFNKMLLNSLITQIQSASTEGIYSVLLVIFGLFGIESLYSLYFHVVRHYLTKFSMIYHDKMNVNFYKKMSNIDISYYDSPIRRDQMSQAHKDMGSIENIFKSVVTMAVALFSLIASIGIILQLDAILIIAILISLIPSFFVKKKIQSNLYETEKELNTTNREIGYMSGIFWNRYIAPEMRIYNHSIVFLNRLKNLYKCKNDENLKLNKKNSFLELIGLLIAGLITIAYNIYIVLLIITKGFSAGDYSYYSSISGTFKGNIDTILSNVSTYIINIKKVENYQNFMDEPSQIQSGTHDLEPMRSIEFVNVSFAYPDSKETVLNNLSFCINAGERIAFAGLNGAGKSTVVKLLFRLYDPTSGIILYNGKDIRSFDLEQYRKQFSAILQDSTVYSIPLRNNVIISDYTQKSSDEEIVEILKRAGLNVNITDLDLPIGKDFDSRGMILSKGQAQSLRLARMFHKNTMFCIFDEPASNLDATIEKQLFDQIFLNFSKEQTVILISHRLCNLKQVDKIIFLENGSNIETGSHNDLIAAKGEYYKLYRIQAERY